MKKNIWIGRNLKINTNQVDWACYLHVFIYFEFQICSSVIANLLAFLVSISNWLNLKAKLLSGFLYWNEEFILKILLNLPVHYNHQLETSVYFLCLHSYFTIFTYFFSLFNVRVVLNRLQGLRGEGIKDFVAIAHDPWN